MVPLVGTGHLAFRRVAALSNPGPVHRHLHRRPARAAGDGAQGSPDGLAHQFPAVHPDAHVHDRTVARTALLTLPPPSDLPQQVERALSEDIGTGDLTAALIPADRSGRAGVI